VHAPASQAAQTAHSERSTGGTAIEAQGLGHDLDGRTVLHDINLRVLAGETVALVGRNGSGKTTMLKHLNGLRRPARGRLIVLGHDIRRARVSDLAAQVGYVFQNPNDQLFKLTVREEIEVGARATHRFDARLLDALYDRFDLHPLLERTPFRLSEGQKKRVAFASALAVRPELLVLDEPTVGQDAASRDALARWLRDWHQTAIVATHDLEFAQEVAPRWAALAGGEIVADDTPAGLMSDAWVMSLAGLRPTPRFQLAAQPDHFTSEVAV
jgi:energy-coupling factor transporter ATP-binding protein EcfA2